MHLLKGQPRALIGGAEPVDLEQSPGDIVILTAADTEISGLAAARRALGEPFPSVRLANWMALGHPYSVDLYSEKVLAHAKLIVLRLLGGASYWAYGSDETVRIARANGRLLAVLPGDATWDEALVAYGTVGAEVSHRLWSYLIEGGSENLTNALRYAARLIGEGDEPPEAKPLPTAGLYAPPSSSGRGEENAYTVAIVFYRALMQSGQTESIDALCAALSARGLTPLPVYVSSLKAKEDAAFVAALFAEHDPVLVLNATSFALSQPGRDFAGTVLDGGARPVMQIAFAGMSEAEWAGSTRGLSPTDLTMSVVMPEIDGRIIARAVSFKEGRALDPLTECRPVRFQPKADRVAFVADLAMRWARLGRTQNAEKRIGIVLSNYPNCDGRIANGVGLDAPASTVNVLAAMRERGYRLHGAPETGAALMGLLLAGPTNSVGGAGALSHGERVAATQPGEGLGTFRSGSVTPHPSPAATPSPFERRESRRPELSVELVCRSLRSITHPCP